MHILLTDDDELLVAPLREFLRLERPDWVVTTSTDGNAALKILRAEPVDLLVTDIQMPTMDGMALLEEIRQDPHLSGLPLIFATGRNDRASMRTGMVSGADDYLTKPYSGEELLAAIEARLKRTPPAQEVAGEREAVALSKALTERELEILHLVGEGLVTKEIAESLKLSPATVSVHRANIMRKLDLHNAAALAALAVRARLS
jgi:DNA-binding NarL/FixJ family response regulator